MASLRLGPSWRRLRALTYKNFLLLVVRHPIAFFIKAYILPIGFLALFLCIPYFLNTNNEYGVGTPAALPRLSAVLDKPLVLVRPPSLGADVNLAITQLTNNLGNDRLQVIDDESTLQTVCQADFRGVSPCFAAVVFHDSPGTNGDATGSEDRHVWNYTIWGSPAYSGNRFSYKSHDNDFEQRYMPLQVALENALTGTDVNPRAMLYTMETQEEVDKYYRRDRTGLIANIYPFALLVSFCFGVYDMVSMITMSRESGMSHLIDAMGGGAITRVLSYLIAFDLAYFPSWIVFGVLYARLYAWHTPAGTLIVWQLLFGLALNSSIVFAAAFFTKARVSSIYVFGAVFLLSVCSQVYSYRQWEVSQGGVLALSLLFPSSNHVFFVQNLANFELNQTALDLGAAPQELRDGIGEAANKVNGATLWLFLFACILVYPVLAVLVEKFMHGISFRRRNFKEGSHDAGAVVVETEDLTKKFTPGIVKQIFCCGSKKSVQAVNGVNLTGHRGQILCLVGPNGSGKTTTLQMLAGLVPATSGSVKMNALPSQVGICPQNNTFWKDLTVREHVRLWDQIKSGRSSDEELERLIAACDLEAQADKKADALSGGQKRKLQLACMFVGDSTVCLIDECTSGLDPLSRRVIWDILLHQRAQRSIVFTTHFLDEVEVLADHIVILSKGRVKCQGPATQLKHHYGGDYSVIIPNHTPAHLDQEYASTIHQDRRVIAVPDSRTAATLARHLAAAGVTDVSIAGPQFEDVFLKVAAEDEQLIAPLRAADAGAEMELTPGEVTSFWAQVRALLWKRFVVLKRFWWPYLFVLVIPLAVVPNLKQDLLFRYEAPDCRPLVTGGYSPIPFGVSYFDYGAYYSDDGYIYHQPQLLLGGPPANNQSLYEVIRGNFSIAQNFNASLYNKWITMQPTEDSFLSFIRRNTTRVDRGIFMASNDSSPILAYDGGFANVCIQPYLVNHKSQTNAQ